MPSPDTAAHGRLDQIADDIDALEREAESLKDSLRTVCAVTGHPEVVRARSGDRFMFMCTFCFSEEHGWSTTKLRPCCSDDFDRQVTRKEFLAMRPVGSLFMAEEHCR